MKRSCVSLAMAACLLLAISCQAGDSAQEEAASEESSASPSPSSAEPLAEIPVESSRQPSPQEEEYNSGRRLKKLTDLNSNELEVVKGLCAKVLEDELGGAVNMWEDTTYYYLPTSEDGFSRGEKLANPVTLVSASVISPFDMGELRRRLKARLSTLAARHEGRDYVVVDSLVVTSPGGGTLAVTYDTVTIVPTEISIE